MSEGARIWLVILGLGAGTFAIPFDPLDEGGLTSVDIRSHLYSYRVRVCYDYYEGWPNVQPICSPASNTVTIGSGSFYSNASFWAESGAAARRAAARIRILFMTVGMDGWISRVGEGIRS